MKEQIITKDAPSAIGPYSQAIKANGFVFLSGQIGINPKDGSVAETLEEQTTQVLNNIAAILKEANSGFYKVVKTSVFLQDLKDFEAMNKIYETYFKAPYPARSTFQVAKLPKDVKVEIEVIATI